jgi:hypothetical protein
MKKCFTKDLGEMAPRFTVMKMTGVWVDMHRQKKGGPAIPVTSCEDP